MVCECVRACESDWFMCGYLKGERNSCKPKTLNILHRSLAECLHVTRISETLLALWNVRRVQG